MFCPLTRQYLPVKSVDAVFRIGIAAGQTAWTSCVKRKDAPVTRVAFGIFVNRLRHDYNAIAFVRDCNFLTVSITSLKQNVFLPANRKRA
jgi:hypothetical protein